MPRELGSRAGGDGRGARLGAGGLHRISFEAFGFFDATLSIARPVTLGSDGLMAFLRKSLVEGRGAARLGRDLTARLIRFAAQDGKRRDAWRGRPCLTHSDFGGSNILMQRAALGWTVAAVIDWEYAFSGTPFFDLGNLLRPPLGDLPDFADAVERGYRASGGALPPDWRRLSQISDLYSWADFLNRPDASEPLIADARRVIERTIADA